MSRIPRTPGEDVLDAIRAHFKQMHDFDGLPARITQERDATRATADVTTIPAGDRDDAAFVCLYCDPPRTLAIDVDADRPTARGLRLVQEHFKEQHAVENLPLDKIYYRGNEKPDLQVTWIPATVQGGSGFACKPCDQQFTGDAPAHDTRRHTYLLATHPELAAAVVEMAPRDQQAYLTAWDNGELRRMATTDALTSMRQLEKTTRQRRPRRLEPPVQGLLLSLVREGRSATRARNHCLKILHKDPWQFIKELRPFINVPRGASQEHVAMKLDLPAGVPPSLSASSFRNYWARIDPAVRCDAEAAGKARRATRNPSE